MTGDADAVLALVDRLRQAPPAGLADVERVFGPVPLAEGNSAFRFYEARAAPPAGGVVRVDYRERVDPPGPFLLVLDLAAAGPAKAAVLARYPGLRITGVPRGRSFDEETSYSRPEPWGRLTFGFAERDPDRLSSVVFGFGPDG